MLNKKKKIVTKVTTKNDILQEPKVKSIIKPSQNTEIMEFNPRDEIENGKSNTKCIDCKWFIKATTYRFEKDIDGREKMPETSYQLNCNNDACFVISTKKEHDPIYGERSFAVRTKRYRDYIDLNAKNCCAYYERKCWKFWA